MFRKQYQQYTNTAFASQLGFTVVELLVVFLIIVTLSSIVVVRWNEASPNRALSIAQNEFITQFRKTQSYAVSSRNLASGESVEYYILRYDVNTEAYKINAIDSSTSKIFHSDLESLNLPSGIYISKLELVSNDSNTKADPIDLGCVWVAISSAYGRTYFLGESNQKTCIQTDVMPQEFQEALFDPPLLSSKANYNLNVTLTHNQKNVSRYINIYGLSGKVEFQ